MAAVTDECRETFEEDIALRGRGRANSQWLRVFLKGAADPATFVNWPSCKEYDLVDAWEEEDQPLLGQAQYRMLPWPEVARFVAVPPPDNLYVSGARGVARDRACCGHARRSRGGGGPQPDWVCPGPDPPSKNKANLH